MFFMMGIMGGQKELNCDQLVICDFCGQYGRYQVFMTYTVLSLFFIPVFKWNRKYFVRMSCCDTVYALDPEVGRRLARGEKTGIRSANLQLISYGNQSQRSGWDYHNEWIAGKKTCEQCGYNTEEDFEYCPKCGHKF